LEEAKRQRFGSRVALVSEERVRVNRERRFVILQNRQQLFQSVLERGVEQPGRRRIRLSQHGHGVHGGDLDLHRGRVEGILEISHRRHKLGGKTLVGQG